MKNTCDQVAERLVGDEPLGTLEDHVALCSSCARMAKLPQMIAEVSRARGSVEPAPGYAMRLAARAMTDRRPRRGRTALIGVGLAGAVGVAVAAFAFLGGSGGSGGTDEPQAIHASATNATDDTTPVLAGTGGAVANDPDDDALLDDLADITDPDRALSFGADWKRIERKIAAADVLLGSEESP
jgi:hypothetical protein